MIDTLPQTPAGESFSSNEETLLAAITEAAERSIQLWRRERNDSEPAATRWMQAAHPAAPGQSAQPAPVELLQVASRSNGAVAHEEEQGVVLVAFRIARNGSVIGCLDSTPDEAGLLVSLIDRTIADSRSSKLNRELQEENDAFAAQLTSDLEELTFLRQMVDQLSTTRVDDEPTDLASSTLPVLNATVRAQCLAYLSIPDPSDPYRAHLETVEGEQQPSSDELMRVVRELGPMAEWRPFIKNWGAYDLPANATRGESTGDFPGVRSAVIAPLYVGEKRYGWLLALNRAPSSEIGLESSWQLASDEFGSGEASLIATTASILAANAANMDLLREKEKLMVSMVRSLVSAIEAKDNYTRGHSERVALYTKRLAAQMGYDAVELEQVYLTALLHDVGKIGVSDAILKKEGKLTAEEYAEIAKHPDEGWAILGDLDHLQYVLPGVLHHHERWDGRGYPDGLAGDAIPLDGRVMAVADAYDAMTSDRPYRKGMPVEKAEAILREGAGVQWDPECVDAFFDCLEDIHEIKRVYRQRPHPVRVPSSDQPEASELLHEIADAE
ncbi:Cyclic di-GMP phosphodiesterase response regulator RpfG [Planctomycetes bacterium MalM25]|nr:Cyclic di-GMP phosphodiesterase response regulator RpfG [Planctomycetes bacterium MalM25]